MTDPAKRARSKGARFGGPLPHARKDDMDRNKPEEPEPFSFVFERLVILRAAHKVLTELGMSPDIADLLDTAAWLAGDDVDGSPEGVTEAPTDGEGKVPEEDGQGA